VGILVILPKLVNSSVTYFDVFEGQNYDCVDLDEVSPKELMCWYPDMPEFPFQCWIERKYRGWSCLSAKCNLSSHWKTGLVCV